MLAKIKESTALTNVGFIQLTHGMVAVVDADMVEELSKYSWQARKSFSRYYAMRKVVNNGKEHWIRMHRQIWKTPNGMIGHHKNRNTLDNRKSNGENMTQKNHRQLHITTIERLAKTYKTSE